MDKAKSLIRQFVLGGLIIAVIIVALVIFGMYRAGLSTKCDGFRGQPAAAVPAECVEYLSPQR